MGLCYGCVLTVQVEEGPNLLLIKCFHQFFDFHGCQICCRQLMVKVRRADPTTGHTAPNRPNVVVATLFNPQCEMIRSFDSPPPITVCLVWRHHRRNSFVRSVNRSKNADTQQFLWLPRCWVTCADSYVVFAVILSRVLMFGARACRLFRPVLSKGQTELLAI